MKPIESIASQREVMDLLQVPSVGGVNQFLPVSLDAMTGIIDQRHLGTEGPGCGSHEAHA